MAIDPLKNFLQTQSLFTVLNQRQIIFILAGTASSQKKLLKFEMSRKTFTQDEKAISNYIYLL